VVCPHCGARDASLDPRDPELIAQKTAKARAEIPQAGKPRKPVLHLTPEEAGALVGGEAPRESPFATLFLPSPRLRGVWPLVDLVLVVLTLPLAIGLFASLLRRRHGRTFTYSGHLLENFLIAVLGGGVILAIGYQAELSHYTNPIVGVGIVGLALRAYLRTWK
jgi:hypothetical protein